MRPFIIFMKLMVEVLTSYLWSFVHRHDPYLVDRALRAACKGMFLQMLSSWANAVTKLALAIPNQNEIEIVEMDSAQLKSKKYLH